MEWSVKFEVCYLPLEADVSGLLLSLEVVVPVGKTPGTSVDDSPTIGETLWALSKSMPMTSRLFSNVVFCFFVTRSPSGGSATLFSMFNGLTTIGLGGQAATSSSLIWTPVGAHCYGVGAASATRTSRLVASSSFFFPPFFFTFVCLTLIRGGMTAIRNKES